jgi:hypothetical protein
MWAMVICGKWMPIVKAYCHKGPRHADGCRTAAGVQKKKQQEAKWREEHPQEMFLYSMRYRMSVKGILTDIRHSAKRRGN